MHFAILGPLQIEDGEAEVAVTAPRQRALLALLLINANQTLSSDRILDELWGDDVPTSGVKALHFHVSRLRESLGDGARVVTRPPGYALEVGRDEFDVYEFEDLAGAGQSQLESNPRLAAETLRAALEIWRGPPLADFTYDEFAGAEVKRLLEAQRAVIADRIEADLALGRHGQLIGELEDLVATHPFDEGFWGQLMTALYRAGRQAEALRAYGKARSLLGEELGIEPSAQLQELEEQILLQAPELGSTTPAPPTASLPHYLTEFVGRHVELQQLHSLLGASRLITLIGLGGIGKTRLGVAAVGRAPQRPRHGAVLIDLVAATDRVAVGEAFARGLGLATEPDIALEETILNHLSRKEMILLVDNCEQALTAAAHVVRRVLASAPSVTIVATGREPLGLPGEVLYRVPPLSVEETEATSPDALQLFVDRARQWRSDLDVDERFAEVALRICRRLDGIPLAIELAAARLRVMSVEELEERLNRRFALLTGGDRARPRHQTLQATIDWSYEHLDDAERSLLRRLTAFRGGFDLAAAEAVAVGSTAEPFLDQLTHLGDLSLVVSGSGHPVRYEMLETIRDYVAPKLAESGEVDEVKRRHAGHYAELARSSTAAIAAGDRIGAYERLERDELNIRDAIDWALEHDEIAMALQLAAGIGDFWFDKSDHEAARRTLAAVVARASDSDGEALFETLTHLSRFATWAGATDEAEEIVARQRHIADRTGDRLLLARSFVGQARTAWARGQLVRARELLIKATAEVDSVTTPDAVGWLAQVAALSAWSGDVATAGEYVAKLEALRVGQDDPRLDATTVDARGEVLAQVGELEEAAAAFRQARERYDALGLMFNAEDMLLKEATVLVDGGRGDEAAPLVASALASSRERNDHRFVADGLRLEGRIAALGGFGETAHHCLRGALRSSHSSGDRHAVIYALHALASLALREDEPERALRLHGAAESIAPETQIRAAVRRRADEEIAAARRMIGDAAADDIWAEAVAIDYPGAVELALGT